VQVTTGNATLGISNYNSIATAAVSGSTFCAVWRTTGGAYGIIGRPVCGATLNDTGQAPEMPGAYNQAYPTADNFSSGTGIPYLMVGNYPWVSFVGQGNPASLVVATDVTDGSPIPVQITTTVEPATNTSSTLDVVTVDTSTAGASNIVAIDSIYSGTNLTHTGTTAVARGAEFEAFNYTATVTDLKGSQYNVNNYGPGTVVTATGSESDVSTYGGTLTNAIGFAVKSPHVDGAITNFYGLKVEDQTGATNNWAIKTGKGLNEFGDAVQFDPANGAQPTCTSAIRFRLWTIAGGTGVKDTVQICAKDAADAYAWRTVY
jgi:hypothetical protein